MTMTFFGRFFGRAVFSHHRRNVSCLKRPIVFTTSWMPERCQLHMSPSPFFHRNFRLSRMIASAKKYDGKSLEELLSAVDKTSYRLFYIKLDEDEKMLLSALYAQATEGKCIEQKPPESRPKEIIYWDNWRKLGDMSQENAAKKYLEIAEKYV